MEDLHNYAHNSILIQEQIRIEHLATRGALFFSNEEGKILRNLSYCLVNTPEREEEHSSSEIYYTPD